MQPSPPRNTHSSGHVPALDGVRGLAVLIIFLVHYGGGAQSSRPLVRLAGSALQLGWSGVTLFFVLSGFLITGILWGSRGRPHWWRTFAIRRALRIFPLYYLTLLVITLVALWRHTLGAGLHTLFIYSIYAQNYNFDGHMPHVVPMEVWHFWSLAVEEQFYLVWPFLLLAMPSVRQARRLCVALFLASFLFRIAIVATGHFVALSQSTPAHAGELALGAWLALTLIDRPQWLSRARRFARTVFLAALAAAVACGGRAHNFKLEQPPMYLGGILALSVASGALILLALAGGRTARLLSLAPLRRLGTISYGIYVYHIFLMFLFKRITWKLVPHGSHNTYYGVRLLVAAALTLLVAELSFRFFEQPLLRLKDRLAPSPTPPELASASRT
ncbi:MAG TPA: acyltransferase [Acidobacteriaceae bacterium]